MIKAVVFDLGGVLVDDVWEHLLLDDHGVRSRYPSLDVCELERIGKILWDAFAYVPQSRRNNWRTLEKRYWELFISYFSNQFGIDPPQAQDFIEMTEEFIRPVRGMKTMLDDVLKSNTAIALCSNNTEFWYARQHDRLGLGRIPSDRAILSCREGVPKSSAGLEMFHAAAAALGVHPQDCLFIDDRNSNVRRARELGMEGFEFSGVADLQREFRNRGLRL